jgi:hypothetical protein
MVTWLMGWVGYPGYPQLWLLKHCQLYLSQTFLKIWELTWNTGYYLVCQASPSYKLANNRKHNCQAFFLNHEKQGKKIYKWTIDQWIYSYFVLNSKQSLQKQKITIATLGPILKSQLSWKSDKSQLARWGHDVVLFSQGTGHPPTHPDHMDFFIWIVQ